MINYYSFFSCRPGIAPQGPPVGIVQLILLLLLLVLIVILIMIIVVSRNIDIKTKIGFNESFATVVLKFNLEMILKIYPRTEIR